VTSLVALIDRFGDLHGSPRVPRLEYVEVIPMSFGRATLAYSARVIADNQDLAREMGVSEQDIAAAVAAARGSK
jgi:hypothetical protein